MGLPYCLNRGIEIAKGTYIARMDGDDICFPKRFEKQLQYMETHKDITICGTNRLQFGNGKGELHFPEESEALRIRMLFGSPIAHPSWLIRKEHFDKYGFRYDESFYYSQDYELLYRVWQKCKMACVQEVLLKYRVKKRGSRVKSKGNVYTYKVLKRILSDLHLRFRKREMDMLLGYENDFSKLSTIQTLVQIYRKIILQNKKYQVYQQDLLEKTLKRSLCMKCEKKIWMLFLFWHIIKPQEVWKYIVERKQKNTNAVYY